MTILGRYLLRQNIQLIFICMGLGIVIYLLSDIFDRLDDFVEAGLGVSTIATYFVAKIPLIISQIMPAVFLIALTVQLGLMTRNRELLALQTGGVSYAKLAAFFVIYSIVWSVLQLGFSQYVGVLGHKVSNRIWAEDVRQRNLANRTIRNLWFRDGDYIIRLGETQPQAEKGKDLAAYQLSSDRKSLTHIISAKRFEANGNEWTLFEVQTLTPGEFTQAVLPEKRIILQQDLKAFMAVDSKAKPEQLSLWELGDAIAMLEKSGSNVERLKTTWHGKWSYAFAVVTMALVALGVSTFKKTTYVNVILSLLVTFIFYGVHMVGTTMGEKGILPPIAGAWLGNTVFILVAMSRLFWVSSKK